MSEWRKPVPRVDAESKPFWEACRRHELYLQRCRACQEFYYYPRNTCPYCLGSDVEWVRLSGRGTVYTFTVTYQHGGEGFRDEVPFVIAYVELEGTGGVKMLTNVVECDPAQVRIGMPVEVTFRDVNDELAIPVFRPRGE
ncbi:MAG: DNA-binding protein [Candidatus Tectimicrobiota bacterium]|nr:MAG: DNA-binding protein [Candidatus Tectomicrobia bacterium]